MPVKRRVLITGARRGIGRAIADRFTRGGWDVVAPTREELELSDLGSVQRFCERADVREMDGLVNNAGENVPLPLEDIAADDLERIIRVNETAPFLLGRALGVAMAQRGWGRIVNIGSVYGFVGRERRSMYTTTKAALNGMTTALAVELGKGGVLVNAVCPGFVDTELTRKNNSPEEIAQLTQMVPLGRLADPVEIADFVFYLGSEANTYITGQAIPIDGGFLCR